MGTMHRSTTGVLDIELATCEVGTILRHLGGAHRGLGSQPLGRGIEIDYAVRSN